jgi:hypothetical protein
VVEAREERLLAEELERDAARWRADPDGVPLWRRRRLAFAEELRRREALRVSEDAAAFLRASRRAERWTRIAIGGAVATAILSLLGGAGAYVSAMREALVTKTEALEQEQRSRLAAEEQRRRLEEAQETINALIDELNREELNERKRELLQQIQEVQASVAKAATPGAATRPASASRPAAAVGQARAPSPSPPAPTAATSAAPAPPEAPAGPLAPVPTW